jgi:hypothetical protein
MNLLQFVGILVAISACIVSAANPQRLIDGLVFKSSVSNPVDSASDSIVELAGSDDSSTYKRAARRYAPDLQSQGSSVDELIEVNGEEL